MSASSKDFSTVSPSAKSLLLAKGYTTIPYAKEAAALMQGPEIFDMSFDQKDLWFWIRVMHFESRYRSIDQLLQKTTSTNILELSSGYSFRGLDLCVRQPGVHYIDTDLPDLIATKQRMIEQIGPPASAGKFELVSLNVLEESAFYEVVGRFGIGPVTIANEGLLMYLNTVEKEKLCSIIHAVLKQHGGYWITTDIYTKRTGEARISLPQSESEAAFFEQHNIEENKFDSFEAAQAFFEAQGFAIVMEAQPNFQELSVLPQLLKVLPEELRANRQPPPKIQATWMLNAL